MAVNKVLLAEVGRVMRLLLVLLLASGIPAFAFAQDASRGEDVRSADEIPKDMPAPPEDAPPAEAPAVDGTDDRPPHPETPESLEEQQPSAELLAKTSYQWLPGIGYGPESSSNGRAASGSTRSKDMILVPPRWDWDGKQWVFYGAGWAKPGTKKVVYSPTAAPGGPDVAANAEQAPAGHRPNEPTPQASTTTVYVWTGVYVAPARPLSRSGTPSTTTTGITGTRPTGVRRRIAARAISYSDRASARALPRTKAGHRAAAEGRRAPGAALHAALQSVPAEPASPASIAAQQASTGSSGNQRGTSGPEQPAATGAAQAESRGGRSGGGRRR